MQISLMFLILATLLKIKEVRFSKEYQKANLKGEACPSEIEAVAACLLQDESCNKGVLFINKRLRRAACPFIAVPEKIKQQAYGQFPKFQQQACCPYPDDVISI